MQEIGKDEFDIAMLAGKFLAGVLTDPEFEQLNVWLDSKKDNRAWFEKITDEIYQQKKINKLSSVPVKELWVSMSRKRRQCRRRHLLKWWGCSAAIILSVVGIAWILFWQENMSDGQVGRQEMAHSVLITTDGTRIPVVELAERMVEEKDGTKISFQDEYLTYEKSEVDTVEEVLYNELVIPRGEEYALVLSDGTKVFLNAESRLRFPIRFSGKTREVELVGEGYFDVVANKDYPFVVKTKEMKVTVLGTEFNVCAYPGNSPEKMTLVNGLVKINVGDEERIVHPREQAVFDQAVCELSVSPVDVSYDIAWKNGRLRFRDKSLVDVMDVIARWYDVEVVFEDEEIQKYHFGGNFDKHARLDLILQAFQSTGKVIFEKKGKILIVRKK